MRLINGNIVENKVTVKTDYQILPFDDVILVDATDGNVIITLPPIVQVLPQNSPFTVKKIDASANTVTIASSDNIDGAASTTITAQNNAKAFLTDGSTWWMIGDFSVSSGAGINTLAAVGAAPNANGGVIAGNTLTLEPADRTHPGVLTETTQSIGGDKDFFGAVTYHNYVIFNNSITYTPTINNTLTGANADIATHATDSLVFTLNTLISIASINNQVIAAGHIIKIQNLTGNPISLINNTGGAPGTSAKILTGYGADLVLPNGGAATLSYDSVNTAWRVISGVFTIGPAELAATAVTPGAYTAANITVDQQGRITAAANGGGGAATFHGFSVYKSAVQTVTSSVDTQITFDTETYDTDGTFAANRHTPNAAGYYQYSAFVGLFAADAPSSGADALLELKKNGTTIKASSNVASAQGTGAAGQALELNVNATVQMNGTTDYMELWITYTSGGTPTIYSAGDAVRTWWEGTCYT